MTTATRNFIIATAGHVDHGKSALVKALTGTDPDRLPEEKIRGITIDLGFAELNLSSNGEKIHAGIVDVPGHEDFVRNMIAGVGSVDLALFVVAADDGWMPQTEEHLQILSYLGVNRAVIALTKTDLGGVQKTALQIREKLRDTAFASSPVVHTSVSNATGLEELRNALASALSSAKPERDTGKPRLFVDRAFSLHGIGTVVTGTLIGGSLRRGQNVIVQPRNSEARIRSIQSHGCEMETAFPGMRTAINVPDLAIGTSGAAISRGDVITEAALEASSILDVRLDRSARLQKKETRPLKTGGSIFLHHGTARVGAKVILLQDDALEIGAHAIAQLRLDAPIFAFLGDRFVIRDRSEQRTLAGGVVLDPDGDRARFRTEAQAKFLSVRANGYDDVGICVKSEIARRGPMRMGALLQKSHFSADETLAALRTLQTQGHVIIRQQIVATDSTWQTLRNQAVTVIDDAHKKTPERPGLDLNELRASLRNLGADVFETLVSDLCAEDFIRKGSIIRRRSHQASLSADLNVTAEKLRRLLSMKPFDPPGRKQIAPDRPSQEVLRFLTEQGDAVDIGADVVLSREAFSRMKDAVVAFISRNGPSTVSELRQELQSSRRIIVPLLERLDREGITRRVGDRRIVEIVATPDAGARLADGSSKS